MLLQPLMEALSRQQIPDAALYVIGTPIGNICDISLRALSVLDAADVVACEDTRNTRALLGAYGLNKTLVAAHQHNEREVAQQLIARLGKGERVALVSDAGTPGVSDPGARIVDSIREAGCHVVPVPGPSAVVTALSVSGFPDSCFKFVGFLPTRNSQRLDVLNDLKNLPATLVFYEAPHRIKEMLGALFQVFGPARRVMVARELTKLFEETWRGALSEADGWISGDSNRMRGEFVVLVEGISTDDRHGNDEEAKRVLGILLESLPVSSAVAAAVRITGQKKNLLYNLALQLKASEG